VNQKITSCMYLQQILRVWDDCGSKFTFINLTCFMHMVSIFEESLQNPIVTEIWRKVESHALSTTEFWPPRNSEVLLQALNRLNIAPSNELTSNILRHSAQLTAIEGEDKLHGVPDIGPNSEFLGREPSIRSQIAKRRDSTCSSLGHPPTVGYTCQCVTSTKFWLSCA
jgi:hypothetical protein